jgi:hypothetical protein
MSHFTTERALWDIASGPPHVMDYMADPGGFLGRYAISDAERSMILNKDVKGLAAAGNSHMLVMMFWLATSGGFDTLGEYLGRMNAPA